MSHRDKGKKPHALIGPIYLNASDLVCDTSKAENPGHQGNQFQPDLFPFCERSEEKIKWRRQEGKKVCY